MFDPTLKCEIREHELLIIPCLLLCVISHLRLPLTVQNYLALKQAGRIPALYPVQDWGCCCTNPRQRKNFPLLQVALSQPQWVYSDLWHWFQWHNFLPKCSVLTKSPSPCPSDHCQLPVPPFRQNPLLVKLSWCNFSRFLWQCREAGAHLCTGLSTMKIAQKCFMAVLQHSQACEWDLRQPGGGLDFVLSVVLLFVEKRLWIRMSNSLET